MGIYLTKSVAVRDRPSLPFSGLRWCRVGGKPLTGGRADVATAMKSLSMNYCGTVLGPLEVLDSELGAVRPVRVGEVESIVAERLDIPSEGCTVPVAT